MKRSVCVLMLLALTPGLSRAQSFTDDPFADDIAPASVALPAPTRLAFLPKGEIALPGPLPGRPLARDRERIAVPTSAGLALVTLDGRRIEVVDGSGEGVSSAATEVRVRQRVYRYRAEAGALVAERRCPRCRTGWSRCWRLAIPVSPTAAPLVVGQRIYVGGLDNRIYALKRRNGHRVWTAEVSGRVRAPLVHLPAPANPADGAVLAVPEGGRRLLALDQAGGRAVGSVELDLAVGSWSGAPLVTDDGRVAIARQSYDPSRAHLVLYEVSRSVPGSSTTSTSPASTSDASPPRTSTTVAGPEPEGSS